MTNFEYIISKLTPRDLAIMATHCGFWDVLYGNKKSASGSILDGRIHKAFENFKRSFDDVYHKGNIYKEGNEKYPNVFDFDRVYLEDKDEWVSYGHGNMLSFQIWLEMPFNESDWGDS